MADQIDARLKQVEFLLELTISKLPFPGGLQDMVDLILVYRLTSEAGEKLMDDIAALEKRVRDGSPPTRVKVRDVVLESYVTSHGFGGSFGGAGPDAYVSQVLRVQSPEVLLPIWRGSVSATQRAATTQAQKRHTEKAKKIRKRPRES